MTWYKRTAVRPISINRMVNIHDVKEKLSFTDKIFYWWFFRNV